jgi:hypothetical protein
MIHVRLRLELDPLALCKPQLIPSAASNWSARGTIHPEASVDVRVPRQVPCLRLRCSPALIDGSLTNHLLDTFSKTKRGVYTTSTKLGTGPYTQLVVPR